MGKKQPRPSKGRQSSALPAGIPSVTNWVDLRPWAAYVLGHHSQAIRLWQTLFWQQPDGESCDDGVPLTLEEFGQARLFLNADMQANVFQELPRILEEFADLNNQLVDAWDSAGRYQTRQFGDGSAPGESAWKRLSLLTDQAQAGSPSLSRWYRLGVAVGRCQYQLFVGESTQQPTGFQSIASDALAVPVHQRLHVPALVSLATIASTSPVLDEAPLVMQFIKSHPELCRYPDCDPARHPYMLDSLLFALDRQLQEDLQSVCRLPPPSRNHSGTRENVNCGLGISWCAGSTLGEEHSTHPGRF